MPDHSNQPASEGLLAEAGWARGVARRLVLDQALADDLVQEAWLAALERPPRRPSRRRPWLTAVLRNAARMTLRASVRREARERRAARHEALPSAEELVERAEGQQRIARAVLELAEPYRSTVLLRYLEGLTAEEIARQGGESPSTVRNRLKRGLDQLRQRFDREAGGDRRAWCLALVPVALPRGSWELAAWKAASAPSITPTSIPGGTAMSVKVSIAAAIVLAGAGGTWAVLSQAPRAASSPGQDSDHAALDAAEAEPSLAALAPGNGRTPPPGSKEAPRPTVRGRVIDAEGRPLAGAQVFVGAHAHPFEGSPQAGFALEGGRLVREEELREWGHLGSDVLRREGLLIGRRLRTDGKGEYAVDLKQHGEAYVCIVRSVGLSPEPEPCGWHETPAEGIDFRATRLPTATLRIFGTERHTGERLAHLSGWAEEARPGETAGEPQHHQGEGALFEWQVGQGGVFEEAIEIEGASRTIRVHIAEPAWARASRDVVLVADARPEVEFLVDPGPGSRGRVLDLQGSPVEGAVVFWGDAMEMRGYPFGPYSPELVPGSARSDAEGWFHLPGAGREITAWHAGHSSATVAAEKAATVALPPRGAILVRASGEPAPARLDDHRDAVSTAGGLLLERVEAGLHGLWIDGQGLLGVEVAPGQTTEVSLDGRLAEVSVEVRAGGAPFLGPIEGVLFGRGPFFTIDEFGARHGRFSIRGALPGELRLQTASGLSAAFDVRGSSAVVDLGTASLTVRAKPGTRIAVIHDDASEIGRWYARWAARTVGEEGALILSPLPEGRYEVVDLESEACVEIDVRGAETEVRLAR